MMRPYKVVKVPQFLGLSVDPGDPYPPDNETFVPQVAGGTQ
jgi:hypothetical protein